MGDVDGIAGDRLAAGRRVRPATQEFAVLAFPRVVIQLMTGALQVLATRPASGREVVKLWVPPLRKDPLTVLREDFDVVKRIAETSTLRLFPSETLEQAEIRIRARVAVEFAGRGVPR